jgi:hypothetical protein
VERLEDLLQGLLAEVGDPEQSISCAIEQIPHKQDTVVLKEIDGSHRQIQLGNG